MAADSLLQLSQLCMQLMEAERKMDDAEKAFKAAKAYHFQISSEDIPLLMSEIGIKEITLSTGEKVSIKDEIACSITEAREEAAFKWLEDNGHDSIIKTEVIVYFGKGEFEKAVELRDKLADDEELDVTPLLTRNVHAQTLKSWLKQKIELEQSEDKPENDVAVPLELFGAMPYSMTKIKAPKG
jgi:hypothetical protein